MRSDFMRHTKKILVSAICLFVSTHISMAQVTVFAAASLTDSLRQLGEAYEKSGGEVGQLELKKNQA